MIVYLNLRYVAEIPHISNESAIHEICTEAT